MNVKCDKDLPTTHQYHMQHTHSHARIKPLPFVQLIKNLMYVTSYRLNNRYILKVLFMCSFLSFHVTSSMVLFKLVLLFHVGSIVDSYYCYIDMLYVNNEIKKKEEQSKEDMIPSTHYRKGANKASEPNLSRHQQPLSLRLQQTRDLSTPFRTVINPQLGPLSGQNQATTNTPSYHVSIPRLDLLGTNLANLVHVPF